MKTTPTEDVLLEAAKGAPAVAGSAAAAMTLNEWVALATGLYVLVQIAYLLRKWWREEQGWTRPPRRNTNDDTGSDDHGGAP